MELELVYCTLIGTLPQGTQFCKDSLTLLMELILVVIAVAIMLVIAMVIMHHPNELEEPVMETSRAKGKLVLGKRDCEPSDVTVVAQQETVREWLNVGN